MDIDIPILNGIRKTIRFGTPNKILILTGLHPKNYQNLIKNIINILLKPISLV